MSPFDPYHRWLGIPPHEQPPTHFRLLGVSDREDDPEVIASAAKRQFQFVKAQSGGPHAADARRLLHEILAARSELLDPARRRSYRARLQEADGPFDSTQGTSDAAPWTLDAAGAAPEHTDWFDPNLAGGDNPFADGTADPQGGVAALPFDTAESSEAGESIGFQSAAERTRGVEFAEPGRRKRGTRPASATVFEAPAPTIRTRPKRGGLSAQAVAFIAFNVLLLAGFLAYQNSRAKNVRAERLAAEAAAQRGAEDSGDAQSVAATSAAPTRAPRTSAPLERARAPDAAPSPATSPKPEPIATAAAAGRPPSNDEDVAAGNSPEAPTERPPPREPAPPDRPGNRAFVEQSRELVEFAGETQPLPAFKESCLYVNQDNFHSVDGSMGVLVEGILGGAVGDRQKLALVRAGKRLPLEFEFDPDRILPKFKRFAKEGERVLAYGWVLDDPVPNPQADEPRRFGPRGTGAGAPVQRKAEFVSFKPSREFGGDKRLQIVPQFQGYLGVVRSVPSWDVLVTAVNSAKTAANDVEIELVITNGKGGKVVARSLVEIGRVPASNKRNPVQKVFTVQNPNPDNPVVAFVEWRLVRAVFVGD